MKIAFVICSRVDSKRIPEKCFALINSEPMIDILIARCLKAADLPVILAVPGKDYDRYRYLKEKFPERFHIHTGQADDPLARTEAVASKFQLGGVIRVCHDKIFIEKTVVDQFLANTKYDYVFSSTLPAGASMEFISARALQQAAYRFKKVEHISYAVKCVTEVTLDLGFVSVSKHRLLVDFSKDLEVLDMVLKNCGHRCSLFEALEFLDKNHYISELNRPPKVTIYTCAYNAGKWIEKAMGSVAMQKGFREMEYILVDDCSTDAGATLLLMQKFCDTYKNARIIRNETNKGLASSSNAALSEARAPYIIRLDADDYFTTPESINKLVEQIELSKADAVYPDNYFGSKRVVQTGETCHHVGGSLFRTRAANHVKFTEGLRGYEGLDFFVRAKNQIKISYLKHPVFFYRQHSNSMSKTNLDERAKILETIGASEI